TREAGRGGRKVDRPCAPQERIDTTPASGRTPCGAPTMTLRYAQPSPKAPAPSRETARFQWQFRWQYVGAQEGIRGHAKQTKTAQLLETARVLLALPNGFPSWTSPVRPRSPALVGSPCTIRGFRWRASTTRIRRERLSRCARRPGGGHVFSENHRAASSTSMPQSSRPSVPPRRPRRLGRA